MPVWALLVCRRNLHRRSVRDVTAATKKQTQILRLFFYPTAGPFEM